MNEKKFNNDLNAVFNVVAVRANIFDLAGKCGNGETEQQRFAAFIPNKTTDEYSLAGTVSLSQVIFMGGKLINGINIVGKLYHLQEKKYFLDGAKSYF